MAKKSNKTASAYSPLFPYLATSHGSILAENELVFDNFCGLGGASVGIARALGQPVTHAINHDRNAVELHHVNCPHTTHHLQDVWSVDPLALAAGRKIALAWFSPDCKHFSKAKGGVPVKKEIRDLAWVVTRKYTCLPDHIKPRVVMLENVEEFKTWGPLGEDGKPDKARAGETFREFIAELRSHGYEVEWRELRACNYGAPTIRKRLFLIARSDGQPINWPAPTHGDPKSAAVRSGALLPWRTAAECIDWHLPCPSIFNRKKPHVPRTRNRVAQGLKRYVLESQDPYIVTCNHAGEHFRGQSIHEPMKTITAANDAHGVVDPLLFPFITNKQHGNIARPADAPLSTITTNSTKNEIVSVQGYFVPRYGERAGQPARVVPLDLPAPTVVTTLNGHRMVTPYLVKTDNGSSSGHAPITTPLSTVVSKAGHNIAAPQLLPAPTSLQAAFINQGVGGRTDPNCANYSPTQPARTVVSSGCRQNVVLGGLIRYNGTGLGLSVNKPLGSLTTKDRFGLNMAYLVRDFGTSTAAPVNRPLPTITQYGHGKSRLTVPSLAPSLTGQQWDTARQVYDLMAEFAPEALEGRADHAQRLVFVTVNGELYIVVDIGMRMLTPRELARCQGFDEDYVLDASLDGKKLSKEVQVKGLGNSVCPDNAEQLVLSNFLPAQQAAD